MGATLRPLLAVSLAASLVSTVAPPAAGEPVVRAVTLSTAGLALIEVEARLGPEPVRLVFPRAVIDDVLKSLVVNDPSGAHITVSLPGPGQFEDIFAALPFTPFDLSDPARLFAALAGTPVRLERRGLVLEGTVLGVSERPSEGGLVPHLSLLLQDRSVRIVPLDDATEVSLVDPSEQAQLDQAVAALRLGPEPRQIPLTISASDATPRTIGLVWLQETPIWRTAWRAVDTPNGLALTGWAVVENATGQSWNNIRLTLATGAVRSIAASLYARSRPERELASGEMKSASEMAFRHGDLGGPAFAVPLAEQAVAEVVADEGVTFSRYTFAEPVTLPAGGMLSLPFLSETLPEARLTLWRGGQSSGQGGQHPEIALEIENPLPLRLPAGVLTLYEPGRGHAGDALIPELAPKARTMVRIGLDTAVSIQEEKGRTERIETVRLVAGMLEITEMLEERTLYRIEGPGEGERRITIEHPRRPGWQMVTAGGIERAESWRFQVSVGAGERITLEVIEQRPERKSLAVTSLETPALLAWAGQSPDPALAERLRQIATLRQRIAEAEAELRRTLRTTEALEREQTRLVDLIVRLGDDSPANRERRARVDAIDAELSAAQTRRKELSDQIDAFEAEIRALLAD